MRVIMMLYQSSSWLCSVGRGRQCRLPLAGSPSRRRLILARVLTLLTRAASPRSGRPAQLQPELHRYRLPLPSDKQSKAPGRTGLHSSRSRSEQRHRGVPFPDRRPRTVDRPAHPGNAVLARARAARDGRKLAPGTWHLAANASRGSGSGSVSQGTAFLDEAAMHAWLAVTTCEQVRSRNPEPELLDLGTIRSLARAAYVMPLPAAPCPLAVPGWSLTLIDSDADGRVGRLKMCSSEIAACSSTAYVRSPWPSRAGAYCIIGALSVGASAAGVADYWKRARPALGARHDYSISISSCKLTRRVNLTYGMLVNDLATSSPYRHSPAPVLHRLLRVSVASVGLIRPCPRPTLGSRVQHCSCGIDPSLGEDADERGQTAGDSSSSLQTGPTAQAGRILRPMHWQMTLLAWSN
ncbi:hypothetical protein CALCODRAFT_181447 [Calocera cornea HHB12733]|uniref:Uncharacterized protein n=1 Tax=Calocera cornea HHB12733 TaxID=1353952 RepID=A0A165HRT0_9BASI|nr:hypothetical protein CALCODRAFT_181447 [Calocera cornea HHB12733]